MSATNATTSGGFAVEVLVLSERTRALAVKMRDCRKMMGFMEYTYPCRRIPMCALVFMSGGSFSFLCDPMQCAATEKHKHTWCVVYTELIFAHTELCDVAVNPALKCDDNAGDDDGECAAGDCAIRVST